MLHVFPVLLWDFSLKTQTFGIRKSNDNSSRGSAHFALFLLDSLRVHHLELATLPWPLLPPRAKHFRILKYIVSLC